MSANNLPRMREAPAELLPLTYLALAGLTGIKDKSIRQAWAEENNEVPWEEVLEQLQVESAKVVAGTDAAMKNHVREFADSLDKLYFLVVQGGKIRVLYGWKTCRLLVATRTRATGLMGDCHVAMSGVLVHPAMWIMAGPAGSQHEKFEVAGKSEVDGRYRGGVAAEPGCCRCGGRARWSQGGGGLVLSIHFHQESHPK